jgi:hypothetical protein
MKSEMTDQKKHPSLELKNLHNQQREIVQIWRTKLKAIKILEQRFGTARYSGDDCLVPEGSHDVHASSIKEFTSSIIGASSYSVTIREKMN